MVTGTPEAGSSRVVPVSPRGPVEKRARPNEDMGTRGGEPETILINEEEERKAGTGGEGTNAETRVLAREMPWALEVRHYTGRMIHHADCAATNIGTAYGLLRSTILPRDAKTVSGCTEDLTGEIAQALLAVSCYCSSYIASGLKFAHVIFSFSCWQAGARALAINDRSKAQEREMEELK